MHLSSTLSLLLLVSVAVVMPDMDAKSVVSADLPPAFVEDPPINGFDRPITFNWTPDGRMFVGEWGGAIRVVKDGVVLSRPAAVLTPRTDWFRGLMGLAVDPHFVTRPYVYIYYAPGVGSYK